MSIADDTVTDMSCHRSHHEQVEHGPDHHVMGSMTSMAISATLHCLTGCAIGEIAGLIIGAAAGLGNAATIAISIALAFFFGYFLSTLPLLKAGLAPRAALTVVLAADTLSILTMEVVDNAVVAVIPGAMNAGLVNVIFWVSMMLSLAVAFVAAVPVNRYLLQRGKGHALTHVYHGRSAATDGWRRLIPAFGSGALAAVIVAFMLGGLLVAAADELSNGTTRADLQDNVSMQTNAGRTGTLRKEKAMKAIVQDTYGEADGLKLRDIDKPLQDTYGSADVQTATGGTR